MACAPYKVRPLDHPVYPENKISNPPFAKTFAFQIVGLCGSLRNASANHGILRAVQQFIPAECTYQIYVPSDLPLMNTDLNSNLPDSVTKWRELASSADVFIIATPEYNFGVTAALKNAIDWASQGPLGNCFNDKPAMLVSAGGGMGGLRSQMAVRDIALFLNLHVMNTPSVTLPIYSPPQPFDMATGDLTHAESIEKLGTAVKVRFISTHTTTHLLTR